MASHILKSPGTKKGAGDWASPFRKIPDLQNEHGSEPGLTMSNSEIHSLLGNALVENAACPLGFHFPRVSLRESTRLVIESHPRVGRMS